VRWLVDTNVLLRSVQPSDPMGERVTRSVSILRSRQEELQITSQNLIEFWAVCTRPVANNGLGLTIAQAEDEITSLRDIFALLPDIPEVFPEWERIVRTYQVIGKQAHDARLVAAMLAHSVTHLLTFNDADFKRYAEITVVNPQDIS
jgi:predicted nucleic acid-binding protein